MLLLTRRKGETLVIGQDVTIEVMQTGPKRTRLGINAPHHVPIVRGELNTPQIDPIESAKRLLTKAGYTVLEPNSE